MKNEYAKQTDKMEKTVAAMKHEFATIRAGRANPAVLDKISVDYYGTPTPIQSLASVSVSEARVLVIQPWDMNALKDIEKAILKSDLGINPTNDGKIIRITFPQLTEERRKEIVKTIHRISEDSKVAIRNIRRDANEAFKKMKKDSLITEDDLATSEKEMQKLTDKYCKDIEDLMKAKEKEIMSI